MSPYLFMLVILANMIREYTNIPGISTGTVSKKISLVADDSLLSFIGSSVVINCVHNILDHFLLVSHLKLNYDKSTLITLGPTIPPWSDEDCIFSFKKKHISEGFKYLGLSVSNNRAKLVASKFVYPFQLLPFPTPAQIKHTWQSLFQCCLGLCSSLNKQRYHVPTQI